MPTAAVPQSACGWRPRDSDFSELIAAHGATAVRFLGSWPIGPTSPVRIGRWPECLNLAFARAHHGLKPGRGHHDRANRWDDSAAGGQGHWATRRQREVIAVHLAAVQERQAACSSPTDGGGRTRLGQPDRHCPKLAPAAGGRPPHGEGPGGWSKPPPHLPPHTSARLEPAACGMTSVIFGS